MKQQTIIMAGGDMIILLSMEHIASDGCRNLKVVTDYAKSKNDKDNTDKEANLEKDIYF